MSTIGEKNENWAKEQNFEHVSNLNTDSELLNCLNAKKNEQNKDASKKAVTKVSMSKKLINFEEEAQ